MQLKMIKQIVQAPICASLTEHICSFHPALAHGQGQGGMWTGKGE